MASCAGLPPVNTSYRLGECSGSRSRYRVALACWSRSTTNTRFPLFTNAAAVLTLVVVLPVPPLKIEKLTTFMILTASLTPHTKKEEYAIVASCLLGKHL